MRRYLLCSTLFLAGCTATVTNQADGISGLTGLGLAPSPAAEQFSQSGSVFLGKFATTSAVNSGREFVSDYHGEIRFTMYPNEKIECRWWTEGRITDETIYDGWDGFVEAFATICTGRLQRDNTFDFKGAYMPSGATIEAADSAEESEQNFRLRGKVEDGRIVGDLEIGSVFRNAVVISDVANPPDLGTGIRFEAIELE